jgi:ABC-type branched-subunit amino acid transport system ATPase component
VTAAEAGQPGTVGAGVHTPRLESDSGRRKALPLLTCEGVSVQFGGLRALENINVEVREGEIVGLIGPNGAGKTTLFECISGFQPVSAGKIQLAGADLLRTAFGLFSRPPSARAYMGIGRTLQNARLFPYLTVTDNVRIALHRHMRHGILADALQLPHGRREEKRVMQEALRLVELMGLRDYAEKLGSELSYGTLRLLELTCMLALKPHLLLLDEPASGISQKETEALGPLLHRIKEQTGATIFIIEHDIPLIMSLSEWVYVFDAGQKLSEGTPQAVQNDGRVIEAYLGTRSEQIKVEEERKQQRPEDAQAPKLLELEGVDVFYGKVQVLYGINLHVRQGERVALLGVNGAGKSTILKAASRLVDPTAGVIRWKGEDIRRMPSERLVHEGLGHVPGGRGLFPSLTVRENLRLGGYMYDSARAVAQEMERVIDYFPWIKQRLGQAAGTLSGGEQQQLATARALMSRPQLLLIDELSLGLAPVAIERLMDAVQRLHEEEQMTIMLVEQQATFALGYTDRAYFLEKGEVRYEGPSGGLSERPDLLRSVFLAGAAAGFGEMAPA